MIFIYTAGGKSSKSRCFRKTADSNRPEITQVIFKSNKTMKRNELERLLYVVRKKFKQTRSEQINDFYICSLSQDQLFIWECFSRSLIRLLSRFKDKRFVSRSQFFTKGFQQIPFQLEIGPAI